MFAAAPARNRGGAYPRQRAHVVSSLAAPVAERLAPRDGKASAATDEFEFWTIKAGPDGLTRISA